MRRAEQLRPYDFKKGHIPWNKGTKGLMATPWNKGLTKEDARIRHSSRGLVKWAKSPEGRQHASEHLKQVSGSFWATASEDEKQEFIEKRSVRIRQTRGSPEACAKQRASMRRAHAKNPEWREKVARINREKWQDPEYRAKSLARLHKGRDESWADPERKERRIKATWEGSHKKPNSTEQIIIDVITEYKLPYKYVGNGEFLLDGKNPDFLNVNGEKKIIEVFGEYWHRDEERGEQARKDFFAQYGFKTLVLWYKEIMASSHEEIAQRIKEFA